MDKKLLVLSSSPHIHAGQDTQKIMLWVLASLVPSGLAAVYFFGLRAFALMAVCVIACHLSELVWQKLAKQKRSVNDFSAAVTGLLLAYNLPPTMEYWKAILGCIFAIIVAKQFFGGIGCNIVNPALAGRAMMVVSWPVAMTTWTIDGVSKATPLALIKLGSETVGGVSMGMPLGAELPSFYDLFIGNVAGCLGETSALALLIGFVILLYKGIIKWQIPVVYIVTVGILTSLFGRPGFYEMFAGGLLIGAIFMATDYTTSPMTTKGQIIFAFGCGLLTSLIRTFGGYPEGVSFAILIMNVTVPLIDKFTTPRIFGEAK